MSYLTDITVGEFIDAIEMNGLKKTQHAFFRFSPESDYNILKRGLPRREDVVAGCATGQAALNLGIDTSDIPTNMLTRRAVYLNDNTTYGLKRIARILRKEFADKLNMKIVDDKLKEMEGFNIGMKVTEGL